jgi:RNA polymerase sigma factor (sigma-70 family)
VVAPAADPSTQSDADLALRLRQGDEAAFAALYERYARPVHDFVARIVREPATAEDVTQATFAQVWERRESLRSPEAVKRWIYQIAHNFALSQVTRGPTTVPMEEELQLAATEPGPEASAESADAARLVWDAAASLEPHQLAILDLSVRCGLASSEIAEILEMDTARASLQVNRAKEALGNAVRYLLVARRRSHCERLAELVPAGVSQLSPEQRATVDHHMRRCPVCQGMALRLTAPEELFGSLLPLPLPARLTTPPHAVLTAAHLGAGQALSTVARPRPLPRHGLGALRHVNPMQAVIAGVAAVAVVAGVVFGITRPTRSGVEGAVTPSASSYASRAWTIGAILPSHADGALGGLTCPSVDNCWAVGGLEASSADPCARGQPLVVHDAGGVWTVINTPVVNPSNSIETASLNDVACVSTADCWAVGVGGGADSGQVLIEHYEGARWTVVNTPPLANGPELSGVACPSTTDCWAVGTVEGGDGGSQPLIEHYDGTVWNVASSPTISVGGMLATLVCVTQSDCWAVGQTVGAAPQGEGQPLIEQYSGGSWQVVGSPTIAAGAVLSAITCPEASDCWAVGSSTSGTANSAALIEHYTGAAWTVSASPVVGAGPEGGYPGSWLASVSCANADYCWAVGTGGPSASQLLIEEYDRGSWRLLDSPTVTDDGTGLSGVTCFATGQCWAVGGGGNNGDDAGPAYVATNSGAAAPSPTATAEPTLGQVWGDSQLGYGQVRPTSIFNGGDPTGSVSNVVWQSWGGPQATGTGIAEYVAPDQIVADGTQEQATVVAFDLGVCQGKFMYQAIEWYFPEEGQAYDPSDYIDICTGTYASEGSGSG